MLSTVVIGCGAVGAYQTNSGDRLPANAVAILEGSQYLRQDWLNRYIDAVRFAQVDGEAIVNSVEHERVKIKPGDHKIAVYFYWDMGSAPAASTCSGQLRGRRGLPGNGGTSVQLRSPGYHNPVLCEFLGRGLKWRNRSFPCPGKLSIAHPLSFVLNFTVNSIIIAATSHWAVSPRFTI